MLLHTLLFNKPHQQRKVHLKQVMTIKEKNTPTHRLQLIAAVMVANLAENITNSLQRFQVTAVHGWSDSMVVLHRLNYHICKQFVHNLIDYINSKAQIQWHYVGTDGNPAVIGSRASNADTLPKMWLEGLTRLQSKEKWPKQIDIEPTKKIRKRSKAHKRSVLHSKTR